MPTAVDLARQQWEEGYRRLEAESRKPDVSARVLEQVEIVMDELRRRVGVTFTLAELAEVYAGSERWAREAIAERSPGSGWAPTASTAADAAFHLYSRGARDYRP